MKFVELIIRVVGNRHLFRLATKALLDECLRARRLSPKKNWLPPRYALLPSAAAVEKALMEADSAGVAASAKKKGSASAFSLLALEDMRDLCLETDSRMAEAASSSPSKRIRKATSGLEDEVKELVRGRLEDIRRRREESVGGGAAAVAANEAAGDEVQPREHCPLADKTMADSVEALIGCFLRYFALHCRFQLRSQNALLLKYKPSGRVALGRPLG